MDTIFMNSESIKIYEPYRVLLNLGHIKKLKEK